MTHHQLGGTAVSAARKSRTDARPSPSDWADHDPMSLVEYVAVFSDEYPVTVSCLENGHPSGQIARQLRKKERTGSPRR
jgi:hypothetical protein